MRLRRIFRERCTQWLGPRAVALAVLLSIALANLPIVRPFVPLQAQQKTKLPRPRRLDEDVTWKRDPVTGELTAISAGGATKGDSAKGPGDAGTSADVHAISVVTQIVPVTCSVIGADGSAVPRHRAQTRAASTGRVPRSMTRAGGIAFAGWLGPTGPA